MAAFAKPDNTRCADTNAGSIQPDTTHINGKYAINYVWTSYVTVSVFSIHSAAS